MAAIKIIIIIIFIVVIRNDRIWTTEDLERKTKDENHLRAQFCGWLDVNFTDDTVLLGTQDCE